MHPIKERGVLLSTRRQFAETFKREAVERLRSGERRFSEGSRLLGVTPSVLRRWKQRDQAHGLADAAR